MLSALRVGDDSPSRSGLATPATTSTTADASTASTSSSTTTVLDATAPTSTSAAPSPPSAGGDVASGLGAGGTGEVAGAASTSPETGDEDLLLPGLGLLLAAAAARRLQGS